MEKMEKVELLLGNSVKEIKIYSDSFYKNNHYDYSDKKWKYLITSLPLVYNLFNIKDTLNKINKELINKYKLSINPDFENILYEYSIIISIYSAIIEFNEYLEYSDNDYVIEMMNNEIFQLSIILKDDFNNLYGIDESDDSEIDDLITEFLDATVVNFHDKDTNNYLIELLREKNILSNNSENIIPLNIINSKNCTPVASVAIIYSK